MTIMRQQVERTEVVISGIAGRFPESENMKQFRDNLMNGADLLTENSSRWKTDNTNLPRRTGKINKLEKFDAFFFGVHYKHADTMDPMARILLERTYEAIIDAGVNPRSLRGSRMGVFVGVCVTECEKTWFYGETHTSDLAVAGCARSMLANRISFWLGVNGPSYAVDSACSSSLVAFQQAYNALSSGEIDSAIVGGTNIMLYQNVLVHFARLGALSPNAECRPFDNEGNGYVRADAIVAVFLQRAEDARRIYATVVHAGVNSDGFKERGITFPSRWSQAKLMRETAAAAGVDPLSVVYVEAHATGTRAGDPEEVAAIDKVFCRETGRDKPLLVGSVKSNMGHAEPASGVCSIAKVIIAMEELVIPPTINYKTPRADIPALVEGRLKVVTEPTPWSGGVVAVNSFGLGGANAHVLLRSPAERASSLQEREQGGAGTSPPLPRLLLVSARTSEGAQVLLAEAARHSPPHEGLVNLLHAIHEKNIPGHIYRAFAVAGADADTKLQVNDVQYWSGEKRPVWFVFAGMGSQWAGMGSALMRLPVFAAAIQRCHAVLAPKGIDIVNVITSQDPKVLEDILNCFVGIAAVQIGLVDVLKTVGIEPDVIIGHSLGEVACGYADGCMTAEETILVAYCRGRASVVSKSIPGLMAAVGVGADQLAPICPADVDLACINSPDSTTISGPSHSIRRFMELLKAKGIFVKEVSSNNIAYHSRYIAPLGKVLKELLKAVLTTPRRRSERWLSSSVPEAKWDSPEAQFCSAEYQSRNQIAPVLFAPLLARVPQDALVVEIAPHGLMQAILKRALPKEVVHVPLARRGCDSLVHVLAAIGRCYNAGLQPRPAALYPAPQWPVPRGTPMLSPLVRWDHEHDWFVGNNETNERDTRAERWVTLTPKDEDTQIWLEHVIDGRPLLPATGYLKLVWETAAMMTGRNYTNTPVVFEDCRFHRATHLPSKEGEVQELTIGVHRANGLWEVSDKGVAVANGRIRLVDDVSTEYFAQSFLQPPSRRLAPTDSEAADASVSTSNPDSGARKSATENQQDMKQSLQPAVGEEVPEFDLSSKDVYKILKLRGYHYQGSFRGITSASVDGYHARIKWNNDWVTFLDNMLQMMVLSSDSTELAVPSGIQKIVVDPRSFMKDIQERSTTTQIANVQYLPELDTVASHNVEIRGLFPTPIARRRTVSDPVLERYEFVPFGPEKGPEAEGEQWEEAAGTRVCVQLSLENRAPITRSSPPVRVAELLGAGRRSLMPHILGALSDLPLVQVTAKMFVKEGTLLDDEGLESVSIEDSSNIDKEKDMDLLVLNTNNFNEDNLENAVASLAEDGIILAVLPRSDIPNVSAAVYSKTIAGSLRSIMELRLKDQRAIVIYMKGGWKVNSTQLKVVRIPEMMKDDSSQAEAFAWISSLKEALKDPNPDEKRVVLVARGALSGALGLFNCLRKEPEPSSRLLRLYLLPEETDAENATLDVLGDMGLRERLELDLAVNVLQEGRWGSMRHLKLPSQPTVLAPHAYIRMAVPGDLSSFTWFQGRIDPRISPTKSDIKRVHVHYASLNFRDVLLATGKIHSHTSTSDPDSVLGFEFSGRLENGQGVMGMNVGGCISSVLEAHPDLVWEVPAHMSLKEAASIPIAYATVVYALDMVGHMAAGESVLVHAASGAVGQAAITLALARGCRVFATVGTPEKKAFLHRTFPQLNAADIGRSRDLSFEPLVMRRTNGKGVDIVLNSLAEDKLQASVRCLGTRGRFLEIGQVDMLNNSAIGMRMLLKQATVHGILLDVLMTEAGSPLWKELIQRTQTLLNIGVIRPLHTHTFERNQVEEAFRFMAAGKHMGKVLIRIREEPEFGVSQSQLLEIPAQPRFYCDSNSSCVIVGGLGGLGVELAHWLVQRGARALVLVSRRGVSSGYQARRLRQWRAAGVRVLVRTDDTATAAGAEALLRAANTLAPVYAIFNLAVVLRDALFANQSPEAFRESFRCKASASVRLDVASRRLCPRLRHFVLFSSVSCGRGNAGQTNYGFANSVMERVARGRREKGLPATAVQWGAVGDVGLVADMRDDEKLRQIGGTLQQSLSSCLKTLDFFLEQELPVVASMVVPEKKTASGERDLIAAVATLLGIRDVKSISHESKLAELGLDSILAVEIQQTLGRDFDILLTAQEIRVLSFARLKEIETEKKSKGKTPVTKTNDESIKAYSNFPNMLPLLQKESMHKIFEAIQKQLANPQQVLHLESAAPDASSVVLMFPSVDGVASPLEPLARCLMRRVAALQLPLKDIDFSVSAIVDMLMPHVRSVTGLESRGGHFNLIGHSLGGLLALEAAARLEADGLSHSGGRIVLLDSSPMFVEKMIWFFANTNNPIKSQALEPIQTKQRKCFEDLLHEEMLICMLSIFSSSTDIEESARQKLPFLNDWKSRVDMYNQLCPVDQYSTNLKTILLDVFYKRLLGGHGYVWPSNRPKLRSLVTLVRPTASALPATVIPEDYGLTEICVSPVRVIYVDGADHYSLPSKHQTANIINSVLDEVEK